MKDMYSRREGSQKKRRKKIRKGEEQKRRTTTRNKLNIKQKVKHKHHLDHLLFFLYQITAYHNPIPMPNAPKVTYTGRY